MTDDVKAAAALWRETTCASSCRCLDCNTARTLLAHIDGEAARTAEAVARAREEQREACAQVVAAWFLSRPAPNSSPREQVRATPLDATPLADELAEAERGEQEAWRQVDAMRERAEKAEARVKELEAQVDGYFAERDGWIAKADKAEAELARLTSDVPGLSPGPAYTTADVDAIEAHRGKPYERLWATVAERDEVVRALRMVLNGGVLTAAERARLLARHPEGT